MMNFQESAVGVPGVCSIPPGMFRVFYEDPRDHHQEVLKDCKDIPAVRQFGKSMLRSQRDSLVIYDSTGEQVRITWD